MVLASEPLAKIFTVGLSYRRISKETYYGLPTRRVPCSSPTTPLSVTFMFVCVSVPPPVHSVSYVEREREREREREEEEEDKTVYRGVFFCDLFVFSEYIFPSSPPRPSS